MKPYRALSNFLKGPVGNNLSNAPNDIKNTKRRLNRLGYFDDEVENNFITRELDNGIKSFQRDNGLRIDGKLLPGGETEQAIAQTLRQDHIDTGGAAQNAFEAYDPENPPPLEITPLNATSEEDVDGALGDESEDEKSENDLPSENVDATGRMIRDETPPFPEIKPLDSPFRPTILKGVDNQTVTDEIMLEEGNPTTKNYMFKDTAKDGGKVTVAGGILLNTVEDAKKFPFTVPDGQGGRRPATEKEIESAFKKVEDVTEKNLKAESFKPKDGPTAKEKNLDDLELPPDLAKREFDEAIRSSANELRRKFPEFDTLPNGAQRALLDMEFNMGIKFHDGSNKRLPGKGWPNLFEAVRNQDWKRAAEESSRNTEGSPGMVERNKNTKRKFLEALERY